MKPKSSALLLIAHGSREGKSNADFLRFVENFSKKRAGEKISGAFLELAAPSVPDAIDSCVRSGAQKVLLVPLMLFWGRHVARDIPTMIEEAKKRHPEILFHYAGAMTDSPKFPNFLETHIESQKK